MKIAVLGAGNGGQALAAHFTLLGHEVCLYNRSRERLEPILQHGGIRLQGAIKAFVKLNKLTDHLAKAIDGADLIMITTTADAHRSLAKELAPLATQGQIIVLNPGRTLGAIEFSQEFYCHTNTRVIIAEAQSLIYACRIQPGAKVNIIGIKDRVMLAAYPSIDTPFVLEILNSVFPCFIEAPNVLATSLENIGAILHPAVVLFNAAAIERGNSFYFYNDMTPAIAAFLEELDKERLAVGKAFGIELHPVSDWVSYAYSNIEGSSLCDKMQNNKAYYKIKAPTRLDSRLLTEDIPTGVLPIVELGKMCGITTPLMNSVLQLSQGLLKVNYYKSGRTLQNLHLDTTTKEEFLNSL